MVSIQMNKIGLNLFERFGFSPKMFQHVKMKFCSLNFDSNMHLKEISRGPFSLRWENFAARKTRQLPQFAYTGPELNLGGPMTR